MFIRFFYKINAAAAPPQESSVAYVATRPTSDAKKVIKKISEAIACQKN